MHRTYANAVCRPLAPGAVAIGGGFWGRIVDQSRTEGLPALLTEYENRNVVRNFLDAAADREDDMFRPLFEEAIFDSDPWIRWRAVRAISDIGIDPSEEQIILATADEDFQVRFEANTVWRRSQGEEAE